MMRVCTRCAETKPLSMFAVSKRGPTKTHPHCKACAAKMSAEYRARTKGDPEANAKRNVYQARWRGKNPEKWRAFSSAWNKAHPEYTRANVANYYAAKQQRTVEWDRELTDLVMLEAADLAVRRREITGFDWHIDHVIPMQGKSVSGLHVWNNLRVIPASENFRKSNRFEGAA